MRLVQDLLRNEQERATDPDTLHAELVQEARVRALRFRLNQFPTLSVLSRIVLVLSRNSSILRIEEILFAPIDRNAECETSTAFRIVWTSSASKIVAIRVIWYSSPSIFEIACIARLTYRLTFVPVPMEWMLNSAMETIRLFQNSHLSGCDHVLSC